MRLIPLLHDDEGLTAAGVTHIVSEAISCVPWRLIGIRKTGQTNKKSRMYFSVHSGLLVCILRHHCAPAKGTRYRALDSKGAP